jgi:hypothetical protein
MLLEPGMKIQINKKTSQHTIDGELLVMSVGRKKVAGKIPYALYSLSQSRDPWKNTTLYEVGDPASLVDHYNNPINYEILEIDGYELNPGDLLEITSEISRQLPIYTSNLAKALSGEGGVITIIAKERVEKAWGSYDMFTILLPSGGLLTTSPNQLIGPHLKKL